MFTLTKRIQYFCIVTVSLFMFSTQSHAFDRRLKVVGKTAGLGTAAGVLAGAGLWAIGATSPKSMLIGASLGLYAGLGLAAYLIFVPEDSMKTSNGPAQPRRPVGRDDWENNPQLEDDTRELLPPAPGTSKGPGAQHPTLLWLPLAQIHF